MSTDLNPDRAVSTTNTREVRTVEQYVDVQNKRYNDVVAQRQDHVVSDGPERGGSPARGKLGNQFGARLWGSASAQYRGDDTDIA